MMKFGYPKSRFSVLMLSLLMAIIFNAPLCRATDVLKAEALLIWGTDDAQSPNPKFTPVDDALAKKLGKSPYRWKHYYEVSRKNLNIASGTTQKDVILSKHCTLEVSNLGGERLEIKLFGKGKLVSTQKELMVGKCMLIIGGASENDTAWFVVLRRTDAVTTTTQPPAIPAVPTQTPPNK
jgi:hypothetical protein